MKPLDSSIWSEAYDLSVPLQVPMAMGQSLVCNEVVRAMPGRRYVCRGVYDTKPVFIKLFSMSPQAKREWQKEKQGIEALHMAGIAAPTIVYSKSSSDLSSHIIVYNELLDAESARYRWEQGNQTTRSILMKQLVELIATHHAAGIRHNDCHLLNFIFSGDILYTLDAADIVKSPAPLSRSTSMQGLVDLLGLFTQKYDAQLPSFYEYYCQCRGISTDSKELTSIGEQVVRLREYKLRKYLVKIYRNCSEFIAERTWKKFYVYRRDADSHNLRMLLSDPDMLLHDSGNQIIKDGNTCTVSLIETLPQHLVCKRYNIKNVWHGLMRAFRESRASRSWRNAYRLSVLHIATPLPTALIEQRFGLIRRKAWLFMPYIDGMSAHYFFRDESKIEEYDIAVNQFTLLFCKMALAKLTHGDMKATNFIFRNNELYVIDLDSMKQHNNDSNFARGFRVDMQRFMHNWDEFPDITALFTEKLLKSPVAEYLPASIKS